MSSGHIRYRPEIDGLRAVCVLGVILFHAGVNLSGGFVGVDVFFVISGFLITKIIAGELQAGRFGLAAFWERRLRRIYPALAFMQGVTLLLGMCLYLPEDLVTLAKSSLYLSCSIPNVNYWRSINYFFEDPVLMPMLHTWSLGVEEQFYVLFPLLLMALAWLVRSRPVRLLVVLASASFLLNLWQMEYGDAQAAFYLLPARAWELLAGSLLAMANPLAGLSARRREAVSALGLVLILGSMLAFWETMGFPGHWAAIPVLGGYLFIAANEGGLTRAARPLTRGAAVLIGKISYSLYLWHWPLVVFPTLFLRDFRVLRAVCVVLTFPVAYFAWQHVEGPIRRKEVLASRRSMFTMFVISNVTMIAVAVFVLRTNGMQFRLRFLPEPVRYALANEYHAPDIKRSSQKQHLAGEVSAIGDRGVNEHSFLLWGDSHAMMTAHVIDEAARAQGISGLYVTQPGLNIVPRRDPIAYPFGSVSGANTPEIRDRMLDDIARRKIRHLILVCYWGVALGYAEGAQDFANFMDEIARRCPDTRVHILDDVPAQNYPSRSALYQALLVRLFPGIYDYRATDEEQYVRSLDPLRDGLASSHNKLAARCGIDYALLDSSGRFRYMDDRHFYYADDHHTTASGSRAYYGRPIADLMREIARPATDKGKGG